MKWGGKKRSAVQDRLRKIDEELAVVQKEIRQRSRIKERPLTSAFQTYREEYHGDSTAPVSRSPREAAPPLNTQRPKDERFQNYLASSFQQLHSLKQERRVQRNKAILMLVVVGIILFWVLWQVFHVFLS
jgi:tetrahydromethanopterin S-methyltransferase subunit G